MHLFQGVLSMLTYNQVMEDSTDYSNHHSGSNASDNKPFYNFLEVKDPEWGKDAPGSHHGWHEAGRYGPDLSLKL
ncbi:hypothetical protein Ahy_A03g013171 [Arachis hypogaea]|uniref:Uncharacterized protein n=1 Tax=Arachis hypogaea TaxID=3818 RepID=A0A445DUV6_ARAHY|nr:hypothetical protein Ahy_A03g013171 [Arachis hypogaea]